MLELDDNVRKTEKMSADRFRAMLGPTAMLSSLPPIPPPPTNDTTAPPIQHEELASSSLFEQAMAQIRAGARIRLDSDSDVADEDDDEPAKRAAPGTIPMTMQQLSAIETTRETRPALAMAPLARPAEGTPAAADLPRITTPTGEIIELKKPKSVPQMQRMQQIERVEPVEPAPELAPRSDKKLMIVALVLIVCLSATIAMLLAT